MTISENPRH